MKGETTQLIKEVAPASALATATISGGVYIVYIQTIIGCIGILTGSILSIVLAIKAIRDMKGNKLLRQAKINDIKYRQQHDLPLRRHTDEDN